MFSANHGTKVRSISEMILVGGHVESTPRQIHGIAGTYQAVLSSSCLIDRFSSS